MTETRKLRVFLCHSSQDKPIVRELYQRLNTAPQGGDKGWIDPWLDEEKLLPGQDWNLEIVKAAEAADAVIVCLSNNSITKEGYVQREIRFVLDIALEKPEGTIFIIPLRLDDCQPPRTLRTWQYVDYFPASQRQRSYERLLASLKARKDKADYARQYDDPQNINTTNTGIINNGDAIESSENKAGRVNSTASKYLLEEQERRLKELKKIRSSLFLFSGRSNTAIQTGLIQSVSAGKRREIIIQLMITWVFFNGFLLYFFLENQYSGMFCFLPWISVLIWVYIWGRVLRRLVNDELERQISACINSMSKLP